MYPNFEECLWITTNVMGYRKDWKVAPTKPPNTAATTNWPSLIHTHLPISHTVIMSRLFLVQSNVLWRRCTSGLFTQASSASYKRVYIFLLLEYNSCRAAPRLIHRALGKLFPHLHLYDLFSTVDLIWTIELIWLCLSYTHICREPFYRCFLEPADQSK